MLRPACVTAFVLLAGPLWAQDGAALYAKRCGMCHDGGVARAPSRRTLRELTPERIVASLSDAGLMRVHGTELSADEKSALAVFLTGKPLGTMTAADTVRRCSSPAPGFSESSVHAWNGWSVTPANDRYQAQPGAGLTAADVPKLKLKWAFGFAGDTSAAVQPSVVDGRVFVGSASGRVYALSLAEGCAYWTFDADTQVRTAVTVSPERGGAAPSLFFADVAANVYSLDASTGQLRWKKKVDDHPVARVTGTPRLHENRLYVPVSSIEEFAGADPRYPCCTFRGSVVALDARTGNQIWKTYTIADVPRPTTKNKVGTQLYGPSGAAAWSSPTLDAARKTIYIGTGDSYSNPAAATSDAIIALDLESGAIKWASQLTAGDAWNVACLSPDPTNCPSTPGPDHDFASPPILVTLPNGDRRLIAGQKSGVVHGLDADTGKVLWSTPIGKGGLLGGIQWGSASDGQYVYVALSDQGLKPAGTGEGGGAGQMMLDPNAGGGLFALRVGDGTRAWSAPPPLCGERPMCSPAQSAAISAVPGVIFSGSLDGHLRAYAAADGRVIWDFDTARDFETVNNVAARGGSIDVGGPAIAEGVVLTTSGYPQFGGKPGNVLLAFSVDGR
ncbi:MAG TPA: PQQ-binding-like beta-propeller repeat protein [Vicinamibacterales bacterium]|nr:PQQ-binding-like beta-propeller repeat protein [Vicinamibacterales bacterium]